VCFHPGLVGDLLDEPDRAQTSLEAAGLPWNKNLVPGDPQPLEIASGVRFGTSAVTTRGLTRTEIVTVASWIAEQLDGLAANGDNTLIEQTIREQVTGLAQQFPIYSSVIVRARLDPAQLCGLPRARLATRFFVF
jgi:glycine/serine hydroxymethyltransferase